MAELIVALDLPEGRAEDALRLADRLPRMRWAKIGPALFFRDGPHLVRALRSRQVSVFLDLKWHDIPSVVAGAVAAARDLDVQLATVHALGGSEMLDGAARAAAGSGLELVAVTVLTSHRPSALEAVLGRGVPDLGLEVVRLARLALAARLRGVVASGHEVGLLREALGPVPWIVVPGIRRPGESAGDQARTSTPAEAVRAGATHLVVGRPITQAKDPAAVYQELEEGAANRP